MKVFESLIPEAKFFKKSIDIYRKYTNKINRIKRRFKLSSDIREKDILKLRDYNFVRFQSILYQMDMFNVLEEQERGLTCDFISEQLDPYALSDVFYQEQESLDLVNALKLNLNTDMLSSGFSFFFNNIVVDTVDSGVDLEVVQNLLEPFVKNQNDILRLKKAAMNEYKRQLYLSVGNYDKERFDNLRYNLNVLFSSMDCSYRSGRKGKVDNRLFKPENNNER